MTDVYGTEMRGLTGYACARFTQRDTAHEETADGCQQAWMRTHEDETQAAQR